MIGSSSCRSHEQAIPDQRGPEGGAPPVAIPPASVLGSVDGDTLRQGFGSPLSTVTGDDVRISALTDRSISENSIAVHPSEPSVLLCAHNSRRPVEWEVQIGWSSDGGSTWSETFVDTAKADPATAIDRNGTFYVGYIHDSSKQVVSISSDGGNTWRNRVVARDASRLSDKNHLVVDTGAASPFEGRLYVAWTAGPTSADNGHIVLSASGDRGTSWTPVQNISLIGAFFELGVNLQTGPGGELYACWAVFDANLQGQGDEVAIGFNASLDGGTSFLGPRLALGGLRGTWSTGVPSTGIKTNSMPAMSVDKSGGPRNGWIYVFWTNIGVPGVNVGDADAYVARSRDGGFTWDNPVRINDDATSNSQWQVWGTCDQANGDLYAVFLDRREDSDNRLARPWLARSRDGGESWVNLPVGDVPFRPMGIATAYMGDYIGIAAQAGHVYPLWGDWRETPFTAYTSPLVFDIRPPLVLCPEPLTVEGSTSGGAAASDPAIAAFLAEALAQDDLDPEPEIRSDAPEFFPLGTTQVTFTATDDAGHASQCSAPLTVVDTTPPDFEVTLSTYLLAPANHRMVPIDVTAAVADLVDPDAGFVLVSIESSEPEQGLGHGDPPNDILQAEFGTPDTRFLLRAESFARDGRTYTIKYAASDASGNSREGALQVRVQP